MAKGPGGKSAGRISIRVVPDASRFKEDLKKSLERIEKSTRLNIPLAIETRQADLDLRKFVKKWNDQELNFDVDAKTKTAAAHMQAFTKARRNVNVDVKVSKASLAKAATLLASLSGARVAGDLVKNVGEKLQNLDRSLPKLAAIALAIATIGSVALASVGGLFTLAAGLVSLAGLAGALPGIFGGVAAGVGVLVIALSSAKTELSSLSGAWTDIKSVIQENFWSKAQQPILDFVNSTLPGLRTSLAGTSTALGSWTASLASGFQKAFAGGALDTMFANLNKSIDIAAGGTGAFASALTTLGVVGSNYLPRLATAFSGLTTKFNDWLTKVAADGTLDKWIEQGITAAKQLGDIFASLGSILSGVFKAAQASGGGGLESLASVLQKIADVVNGPAFQKTLTTLFQGAALGVEGLAKALGPIGDMLSALAPTLAQILSSSGEAVGKLLGEVADAISSPAFQTGLGAFFAGIQAGLLAIGPALPALADAFASVATFAGILAGQLGPVLGAVIQALAPVFVALLTALEPIIPILGEALITAITQLAPSFLSLIEAIAPILPQLAILVVDSLPGLVQAVIILTPMLVWLFGAIQALLGPLVQLASFFVEGQAAVFGMLNPVQFLTDALNGKFGPGIQFVAGLISNMVSAVQTLGGAFGDLAGNVESSFSRVASSVRSALNSVISFANGAIDNVNGITGVVGIPKIPHIPNIALGADIEPVDGGTLARLGEGGKKETVTDYGRTNRLIELANRLATRSLGAGTGPTVDAPITVYTPETDGRILGRQLSRELVRTLAG